MRAFAVLLCAGVVGAVASACETRHIDLGPTGNEGRAELRTVPDASLVAAYGCGDWIDAELKALRAGSCEGYCDSYPTGTYPLDTKASVMAATAGRWVFCGDHLGPDDAVGMEFVPGCRVFFLRFDSNGIAVRGTEAAYQADYDIFDPRPENMPARIDLHFTALNTITLEVEASRCPETVTLRGDGRLLRLARLEGQRFIGDPVH
ncbi:hypothetical protein AKJ09_06683 [Labilithrix luteola]|uniref:Lipoprotein n=1 Tax=Labilithrix luteola TaxID=1391654 RepID=A0A0K1Q3Q3_9BACT|nr:hypothetical protein [Labilithrix luteola]AKV00020.1 hypothetical protein AKJ09_06683 [Labilithrix luteola]